MSELEMVIFHTNDFHGRFSEKHAQRLRRLKEGLRDVLVLDAGDALAATNISPSPLGEPVLEFMAVVPYNAMCLGNREFHIRESILKAKLVRCQHPVLCANIRWRDKLRRGNPAQAELPQMIYPCWKTQLPNGLRVSVLGLTVPMVTESMKVRHLSHFVFDPPLQTAAPLASQLKKDSHLVIALTHLGLKADTHLLEEIPEIDLVIGGAQPHSARKAITGRKRLDRPIGSLGEGSGQAATEFLPKQVERARGGADGAR